MKKPTSIIQMKEITDQLAEIGAPISNEDQVVTLLGNFFLELFNSRDCTRS